MYCIRNDLGVQEELTDAQSYGIIKKQYGHHSNCLKIYRCKIISGKEEGLLGG